MQFDSFEKLILWLMLFGENVNTRQIDPLSPEQCDPLRILSKKVLIEA
jgi:hypothetical protein